MNATLQVLRYEAGDVARSRWLLGYVLVLMAVTEGLLRFGGGVGQALLGLTNALLLIVPLAGLVFGTSYLYGARELTVQLLAQPVNRRQVFAALVGGLAGPLCAGFVVGIVVPFALRGAAAVEHAQTLALVLAVGTALTCVFVALATLLAVRFEDRVKGLGAAILLWLALTVLYDGLLLAGIAAFAHYPLETPVLVLTLLNPVDLARVLLLLHFDAAALMGYTGAVFEAFFGGRLGPSVATGALVLWVILPLAAARRGFVRKDF